MTTRFKKGNARLRKTTISETEHSSELHVSAALYLARLGSGLGHWCDVTTWGGEQESNPGRPIMRKCVSV